MRGYATESVARGWRPWLAIAAAGALAFVVTLGLREGLYRVLVAISGNTARSVLLDAAFLVLAGEVLVWYGALVAPVALRPTTARTLATIYGACCAIVMLVTLVRTDIGFAITAAAFALGAIYAARAMRDNPTLSARPRSAL